MIDIDVNEVGPVEYLVVGFPAGKASVSGEMVSELMGLIENRTILLLDVVMVTRADDGSIDATELHDADDSEVGQLRALDRDLAILLAEPEIEEIGATLQPGRAAVVLVWENTWATPFASAVRRAGGELLGSSGIPTPTLIEAIEADRRAALERSMTVQPCTHPLAETSTNLPERRQWAK
jgi:hypothetical protein